MSIEALPNELLVHIFSYLPWNSLRDSLSLVNRRWYQVVGMTQLTNKTTLHLSKSVWPQMEQESEHCQDIVIPFEVLGGSSREYRNFSCSMHAMDFQTMRGAFATVLNYCHRRWNMNELRMTSRYGQFILFLQYHRHLLDDVVKAVIKVKEFPPEEGCFEEKPPHDTHFVLPMAKLKQLNFEYSVWRIDFQAPPCVLSLLTPNLETVNVRRCLMRNSIKLEFNDCSKVHSVIFFNWTSSDGIQDPVELRSILPQASGNTRLTLVNCSIAATFNAMFGNLQTIVLNRVRITPTDDPLECLNLTKLLLRSVNLQKPLKLRVPQLRTLRCGDTRILGMLHLEDALEAARLEIDWFNPRRSTHLMATPYSVGLSSFRRLCLKSWQCWVDYAHRNRISWLWPHLTGIPELELQGTFKEDHLNLLKDTCEQLPQINSLRLLGMIVPGQFNFLSVNVQNVYIEDCSIEGNSIEFPPSVESVQVRKLWKATEDTGGAEICLLPPNRYSPLECKIVQIQKNTYGQKQQNTETVYRTMYSTRDCHVSDGDHRQ